MIPTPPSPWVAGSPRQNVNVQLFCLPYAGGGASIYRSWTAVFPHDIAVVPVQLPGRENRMAEPAIESLPALVEQLVQALRPHLGTPFALFGHSMGALLSFELARALRRHGLPQPVHLFLSGRRAPALPPLDAPIHTLSRDGFVGRIRELGGTPDDVFAHPELLELVLPVLRTDFALCETYNYAPEPPLACGMQVFGGTSDTLTPVGDLDAWQQETTGAFRKRVLPGGHFFINDARARQHIQTAIVSTLQMLWL